MTTPVGPSIKELEKTIGNMGGLDSATVVQVDHTVCVSIYRKGGCKRTHATVCGHMRNRFDKRNIIVLENPIEDTICYKAYVRGPKKGTPFTRSKVFVTRELLGK